jgi:meso-butanediol dehydrogenase/(S,S)-butanediol dehydrogenase/diacetyl reductase
MEKLMRFKDKVVVIAGASRGIGRGIALRFASEGADLVVSANEDRVKDVAEEIKALGRRAVPVFCDVTIKSMGA